MRRTTGTGPNARLTEARARVRVRNRVSARLAWIRGPLAAVAISTAALTAAVGAPAATNPSGAGQATSTDEKSPPLHTELATALARIEDEPEEGWLELVRLLEHRTRDSGLLGLARAGCNLRARLPRTARRTVEDLIRLVIRDAIGDGRFDEEYAVVARRLAQAPPPPGGRSALDELIDVAPELPPGHRLAVLLYAHGALLDSRAGRIDRALRRNRDAVSAARLGLPSGDSLRIKVEINFANSLRENGGGSEFLEQAEDCARLVRDHLEPSHPDRLLALNLQGLARKEKRDFAGALAVYREVRAAYLEDLPPEHPKVLMIENNIAVALELSGQIDEALRLNERILEVRQRIYPPDHPDLQIARMNTALCRRRAGMPREALPLLEEVVRIYERASRPDMRATIRTRKNLAALYSTLGDYEKAASFYPRLIEACQAHFGPDDPETLGALQDLAILLGHQGRYDEARAASEKLLSKSPPPAESPVTLEYQSQLAHALKDLGDLWRARLLEEQIVATCDALYPEHPGLWQFRNNLSVTLCRMGSFERALELVERAFEDIEGTYDEDTHALRLRHNRAVYRRHLGQTEAALAELEELRAIRRERSDGMTRDLAEVLHELATVRMDVGDHEGARELLVRVLDFTEKSLEPYDALALAARTTLIEAWLAQERYDRARAEGLTLLRELGSYSESATRQSTREARAIGHAIQGRVPVLLSLALRDPKDQELQRQVFEIVESARGLSVARPADRADDGDARLRWIRERLNDLVAAATDETDEESLRELRELSDERDRLQRERHEVDSRPSRSALLDTQNLAEALPEGSAAVGFLRTSLGLDPSCPQHLVAGVLRPDGTVTYIDLGRAHDLEARVRDWRVAIGRPFAATRGVIAPPKSAAPPTPSQAAAGTELTRHIVGPVLRATGNASRLHICLDDFLCSLPLDALPSEGKLVGDHVRLLVESSFARLVEPRRPLRRASPPRLCLLGAIDYGAAQEASSTLESRSISRSFADLPGAAAEVSSVDRLFQTRFGLPAIVLRGDAATAARFRENVVDARFVHVATHAWFAGPSDLGVAAGTDDTSSLLAGMAPLTLSGLAMSGANLGRDDLGRPIGILTAEELAGFDLSSCELAFLSACDTGVGVRGAGQVTQSLQAALSAAGARATITTLWPVDDRCTQELVKHFYEGIWERDLGRADALWRAKRRLRDEGHPVHAWAGFVLTGEP